jgi:RNA recognition motif-containing protein
MFKTTINYNTTASKPAANSQQDMKLFIGCIPGSATDEEIYSVLSKIAPIKSLRLERRKNNKCSGYGYAIVTS